MTAPDDFLAGIDPVSAFRAEVEAEVAVEVERQMLGDLSEFKPTGLLNLLGIEVDAGDGSDSRSSDG